MTTALETAFPLGANFVAATIRAKLAEAMVGVFSTPNLSAEDFTIQPYRALAIYGDDGDLEFYAYDASDTTTADDGGVSCIVVSGRRYKKRIDVIVRDSALSATTDAQPGSPTLGDSYILTASPSGTDWASEAKAVAQYTARGWIFRQPFVGMVVYVEDEEAFYHYDPNGDWVIGLGTGALADGSVRPSKLFFPFGQIRVVDQRNAPPGGTPTNGTAYQVGTSPSGLFTGHANDIAMWNSAGAGAWEFFDAVEGDTIYRLDIGVPYSFRSGVWVRTTAAPVLVQSHYVGTAGSTSTSSSITNRISSPSITAAVGQKIRVTLQVVSHGIPGGSTGTPEFGIRIDTGAAITAVMLASTSDTLPSNVPQFIELSVPDASAHTYHVATHTPSGNRTIAANVSRAIFEVIQPS